MSFISKVFNKPEPASRSEVIQKLRDIDDHISACLQFLEKKCESEAATAKENVHKNREIAIEAIRRKLQHEKEMLFLDGHLISIEMLNLALQREDADITVADAVDVTKDTLADIYTKINIDESYNPITCDQTYFTQNLTEEELEQALEELKDENISETSDAATGDNATKETVSKVEDADIAALEALVL